MVEAYELDLDTLAPQPHKVLIAGEVLEVSAPKLKTVFKIQRAVEKMKTGDPAAFEEFKDALSIVLPRLNDEDFDMTAQQLIALSEFIFQIAQPADTALIKPKGGGEKKDDQDSPTDS